MGIADAFFGQFMEAGNGHRQHQGGAAVAAFDDLLDDHFVEGDGEVF